MWTSEGSATIRLGASFDISFCPDTVIPRRSTPRSSALIPIVVLMHVARAVATRSVGEKVSPLPLLSLGASVEIFACEGPCVASQCKSPVYLTETSTMRNNATALSFCHIRLNRSYDRREPHVFAGGCLGHNGARKPA